MKYPNQGRIQDLVRGGAKLTEWRRMRRLSLRTRIYGSTLLHKFFMTPPIFPSEEQKKKKKFSTSTYSPYGPSPTLFITTRASMRPSSIITVLKNVTCNCQCLKLQNFGQGCYKPGGGGASAPLAPPLNPPLMLHKNV